MSNGFRGRKEKKKLILHLKEELMAARDNRMPKNPPKHIYMRFDLSFNFMSQCLHITRAYNTHGSILSSIGAILCCTFDAAPSIKDLISCELL